MIHLGDITKIHGDEIEPVDCITFGSPCQDLSLRDVGRDLPENDPVFLLRLCESSRK